MQSRNGGELSRTRKESDHIVVGEITSNKSLTDSKFKLGFCDNPKRLNVALSRAKELLVIIGNGTLFGSNDRNWDSLLAFFKANNLFKGAVPAWTFKPTPKPSEGSGGDVNDDQAWAGEDRRM